MFLSSSTKLLISQILAWHPFENLVFVLCRHEDQIQHQIIKMLRVKISLCCAHVECNHVRSQMWASVFCDSVYDTFNMIRSN